jgi:hypothetical protein
MALAIIVELYFILRTCALLLTVQNACLLACLLSATPVNGLSVALYLSINRSNYSLGRCNLLRSL